MGKSRTRKLAPSMLPTSLALLVAGSAAMAQDEEPVAIDPIEIIGVTPTHGTGLPRSKIPANVQTGTSEEIEESQAADVTEFMNNRLGSVHINDGQNNPLQRDVSYRGFTASPLLGLPQGLSMYQDGMRINEPFGDTLNWALIPDSSISSINLIPGSNPLFGRNTLGGAISLQTKTGFSHPGTRGEVYTGSWERYYAQLENGGSNGNWGWFITGEYFDEQGWRDFSPSDASRLFGNLTWNASNDTSFNLSLNLADTDLVGNGPAPAGLLAIDREAVFTVPDQTLNDLVMFNLRGTHQASSSVLLTGNLYYRMSDIETFNGDDSDFEACEDPANDGFVCAEEVDDATGEAIEEVVLDPRLGPVPAIATVGDADAGIPAGTLNRSVTDQDGFGGALQTAFLQDLFSRQNQFIIGVEADRGETDFSSSTELGALDENRRAVGSGFFNGESFVGVQSDTNNYSVYFTDTLSVTEALAVTLSGRYSYTEVKLDDQRGTALDGDHDFSRFNPAIGATFQPVLAFGVYGGYSESNRAPTPVELTCADPNDPCRLPNAFLADPPLDDVVANTFEAGFRGQLASVNYNLGAFSTTNEDDILFISAGTLVSEGFFDNVGDTRRQGIELNLDGAIGERFNWFVNYTYLDAEFRDSFSVASANHPNPDREDPNEIDVESGDQIPLTPENILKVGFDVEVIPGLSFGADVLYNDEQFFRGDEGNKEDPVDDFTVANLRGDYWLTDHISVFGRVTNVFDEDYETFGLFGEGDELDEKGLAGIPAERNRFLSAGAPRAGWIGLRASF